MIFSPCTVHNLWFSSLVSSPQLEVASPKWPILHASATKAEGVFAILQHARQGVKIVMHFCPENAVFVGLHQAEVNPGGHERQRNYYLIYP